VAADFRHSGNPKIQYRRGCDETRGAWLIENSALRMSTSECIAPMSTLLEMLKPIDPTGW